MSHRQLSSLLLGFLISFSLFFMNLKATAAPAETLNNGLIKQASKMEMGGTPVSTVGFYDFNLQLCFDETVNQNGWIYVEQVIALNCPSRGITETTGIEQLTALQSLNLAENTLINVMPLQFLTSLTALDLSGNHQVQFYEVDMVIRNNPQLTVLGLADIQMGYFPNYYTPMGLPYGFTQLNLDRTGLMFDLVSLNSYNSLTNLSAAGNQITYATGLETMTNLSYLDLSDNALMDLYGLTMPGVSQLTVLNLSGNSQLPFTVISQVLQNNPNLTEIGLADIPIGSQFPLLMGPSGPYALTALDLNRTGFNDLANLMNYTTLQTLRLSGNNLDYAYGIEYLTQLNELDLSNNQLTLTNPMNTLSQLVVLDLSNNPLDMIYGLDTLANLRVLNLSHTRLANSGDLYNLTQLTELYLAGLTIPGMELLNIARQNPQLTALSLANTDLTGQFFPGHNWPMLKTLDLSYTGIMDLNLVSPVESLYLAGNQLMNAYSLQMLNSLTRLDLSGNHTLPFSEIDSIIRNNPQLTELGLADIPIGNFPDYQTPMGQPYGFVTLNLNRTGLSMDLMSLSNYKTLKQLHVSGNLLNALIGLQNLSNLTVLDVSHNALMWVGELTSPELTQLTSLNLSGNSQLMFNDVQQVLTHHTGLTEIALADIAIGPQFPSLYGPNGPYPLTALDLSRTGVNDLFSLNNYPALQTLYLAGNGIEYPAGLEMLTQLKLLDLSDNHIMAAHDFSAYAQLTHLNLSHNPLEMVTGLGNLYALRSLDLSYTSLMTVANLNGVNQLTELHLSGLTVPGQDLLMIAQQNPQLTTLSLAGADLSFQYLMTDTWPNLKALDISNTGIMDVFVMPGLESLNAAGNQLNNAFSLQAVNTLKSLDLSGNTQLMFSDIHMVIQNNPGLKQLGLADITIGTFPSYQTPEWQPYGFEQLNLDRTGLTDLMSFYSYDNLTHLSVSGNQLNNLTGIGDLMKLTHLDISNNPVMGIYELTMPAITQLQSLSLAGNSMIPFFEVHQVITNNPGLTELDLADIAIGPQFPEIFGPFGYHSFKSLGLNRTGVNDMMSLMNYSQLKTLLLEDNAIVSVFGLEGLMSLALLDAKDNAMINCMDLDYLKSMLPNLEVLSPSHCP